MVNKLNIECSSRYYKAAADFKSRTYILLISSRKLTSGPADPMSSNVSRSKNLTVLSAEPVSQHQKHDNEMF